jgi:hypothetical protein
VLLTDFGLALPIEQEGDLESWGTAHYVAPEQIGSLDEIDQKADLYSLAAMVYEMLVGQPPFPEAAGMADVGQRASMKPPLPSSVNPYLSRQVDAVLRKALSRSPEKRYRTAVEFMEALTAGLGDTLGQVVEDGELPPLPAATQKERDSGPAVSQVSVVDKIASQLEMEAEGTAQRKRLTRRQRTMLGCWGVLVAIAVLLIGTAYLLSQFLAGEGAITAAAAVAASYTVTPTESAAALPTSALTHTPMMIIVEVTADPPTVTATPMPTEPAPSPTATATATLIPPLPTPTPPFTGPAVRFFYDAYSFYMFNPGDEPLRVGAIAFQAVDGEGQATGQDFRGREWSGIYASLESGRCDAIELLDAPNWMRPGECTAYNVTVTPPINSTSAFWLASHGIVSFRVFWNGRDIGACPVVTGVCELRLP